MHRTILKVAAYLIKYLIDKRALEVALMEKIINEYRGLAKKESIGKNELDDWHAQFRFYSANINKLVSSSCSNEDKKKVYHALMAARVLCWTLKFETKPDNEIKNIMYNRALAIEGNNAYHSSYERFVKELAENGWQGIYLPSEENISKVKDWCRANIDELQKLQAEVKSRVKHVDLMLNIVNEVSG